MKGIGLVTKRGEGPGRKKVGEVRKGGGDVRSNQIFPLSQNVFTKGVTI